MTEISYPFAADSAGGGAQMVSQAQWQRMSRLFVDDRVDWLLTKTYTDADLPFAATVTGNSVAIAAGNAFVGGFYYQLTAPQSVSIAANTGATSRIDLIVVRADLAAGAVNLAVVQGQAAASPVVPTPSKTLGGSWEMPLYRVNVPANSGAVTVTSTMVFDMPGSVAVPWNSGTIGPMSQIGSFLLDLDNNNNDSQTEYFHGRDGFAATRHFGKSKPFTPSLLNVSDSPDVPDRTGTWRWVSPGVVYFTATIHNGYDIGSNLTGGHTIVAVSLPQSAASGVDQILHGHISNPGRSGNKPNFMSITGKINAGELTKVNLYAPSISSLSEGLDGLNGLPAGATLNISGTYLTNVFGD